MPTITYKNNMEKALERWLKTLPAMNNPCVVLLEILVSLGFKNNAIMCGRRKEIFSPTGLDGRPLTPLDLYERIVNTVKTLIDVSKDMEKDPSDQDDIIMRGVVTDLYDVLTLHVSGSFSFPELDVQTPIWDKVTTGVETSNIGTSTDDLPEISDKQPDIPLLKPTPVSSPQLEKNSSDLKANVSSFASMAAKPSSGEDGFKPVETKKKTSLHGNFKIIKIEKDHRNGAEYMTFIIYVRGQFYNTAVGDGIVGCEKQHFADIPLANKSKYIKINGRCYLSEDSASIKFLESLSDEQLGSLLGWATPNKNPKEENQPVFLNCQEGNFLDCDAAFYKEE